MAQHLDRQKAVKAIRDTLVLQMIQLEMLGDMRTAADLSAAVERLNDQLGEAPSSDEIDRLRRTFFP